MGKLNNQLRHFPSYLFEENAGNAFPRPKLKQLLGTIPLDSPSLECLLHSHFSFRAYFFKISRSPPLRPPLHYPGITKLNLVIVLLHIVLKKIHHRREPN